MSMPNWIRNFYVGSQIREPQKIKKKIDQGKPVVGIYLITLSDNPGNLLDIIPAALLLQKSYARLCPPIIGMEKGKEAAIEAAAAMVTEVYEATGDFRVKEYWMRASGHARKALTAEK